MRLSAPCMRWARMDSNLHRSMPRSLSGSSPGVPEKTDQPRPTSVARIEAVWKEALFVPPASAGNTILFQSLQHLPRELDEPLGRWITARIDLLPPPTALEAVRRLTPTDKDEAMYWYAVGITRLRYVALRCNEPGMGDIPILGRLWIGGTKAPGRSGNAKSMELAALERIIQNFDTAVPVNMKKWQNCRRNRPGTGSDWQTAHAALRSRLTEAVENRRAAQP